MSRLYETLRQLERAKDRSGSTAPNAENPDQLLGGILASSIEVEQSPRATIQANESSRLVALREPKSLGAEKFRALAARLENLRRAADLTAVQVTSAAIHDGKSLVSANLALTLAKSGRRVLLVEGDLHRPALSDAFGLKEIRGIRDWWSAESEPADIVQHAYKLDDLGLWFVGAGSSEAEPSAILQSSKFGEMFIRLHGSFDWIVVDSTPLAPIADANLWSRLVDGTLLVVREGVTPVRDLARGVAGLDNPKWLGIVLNEASESDEPNYADHYYGQRK